VPLAEPSPSSVCHRVKDLLLGVIEETVANTVNTLKDSQPATAAVKIQAAGWTAMQNRASAGISSVGIDVTSDLAVGSGSPRVHPTHSLQPLQLRHVITSHLIMEKLVQPPPTTPMPRWLPLLIYCLLPATHLQCPVSNGRCRTLEGGSLH